MIGLILQILLSLDPVQSSHVVAIWHGRPELALQLQRVCRRESRCQAIGIHAIDAHLSARAYWGQVQLGHLRRVCQAHGSDFGRWGTRGAFGLQAAAHWPYLPVCYQPEALDVPLVSAFVAASKWLRVCDRRRRSGWCPRRRS